MEHEIKRLKKIAEEYRKFGIKSKQIMGHVTHQEHSNISTYFADGYDIYSATFDKVTLSFYSSIIEMPFNATKEYLGRTADKAEKCLKKLNQEFDNTEHEEIERKKMKRIENLKKELNALEK